MDSRSLDCYYIDARNLSLEDRKYIDAQLEQHAFVYNPIIGLQEFIFYIRKGDIGLLRLPSYVQPIPTPPHLLP